MGMLDSQRIELPCPHCGHKISKNLAQLKTHHQGITCRCGVVFNVDKAQLLRDIDKVEQAAAELKRTLGRLR